MSNGDRIGTSIGPYTIETLLGVGGMAEVFAARDRAGKRVAMKLLLPEHSQHPDLRDRFVREAYVANRIAHPGVVRVHDHGVDHDGTAYFVMDLLEGNTLDAIRRNRGKLPSSEVIAIGIQLMDVLAAAHRASVVHRDVKPENTFITSDGRLKLLDFGIARLLDGPGTTRTGTIMGTPAFMAPEQASGYAKNADPRSDIWSAGAILFVLATGDDVHPAATPMMQMMVAATTQARSVARVAPDIAPELARIIDVALAFESKDRWPSADAMRDALATCCSKS